MSVGAKVTAGACALLLAGWWSYRADQADTACPPVGPLGTRVAAAAGGWVHAAATEPVPSPKEVQREVDGALDVVVGWVRTFANAANGKQPPKQAAPVAETPRKVEGFTAEQVRIARDAIKVGREMGVPERGLVVILAAGLQESGLRNLNYGDRDSLGWLQQRPSQGWGSPAQVRDPEYAARKFYTALLRVPGWEDRSVTRAAQAVQISGYPKAYAKWQDEAERLVEALADGRGAEGPDCGERAPQATTAPPATPVGFDRLGNPRTVAEATAWAQRMSVTRTPITPDMCLHYMAEAFGWGYSGVPTAYLHWLRTPEKYRGRGTPPRGALVYWRTPGAGHIALSAGGGRVWSTDVPVEGRMGLVDIEVIDRWGPRLGWSQPIFPGRV